MYMIYIRVSSADQNLDRQRLEVGKWLAEKGIQDKAGQVRWYEEKASGKDIKGRPVFRKLLDDIREDDTLVVLSLDRLGRDFDDIQTTIHDLRQKGAIFEVIDAPFLSPGAYPGDMGKALSSMLISLFGYIAENERKKIKERQAQGIEAAKARGVYGYERKKRKRTEVNMNWLEDQLKAGNANRAMLQKQLGVSRPTLLKMIRELGY